MKQFSENRLLKKILILLFIFVGAVVVIYATGLSFSYILQKYKSDIEKQRNRIDASIIMANRFQNIEKNIYKLAILNKKQRSIIYNDILKDIDTIDKYLDVLKNGGDIFYKVELNTDNASNIMKKFHISKDVNEKYNILYIEMKPKIKRIKKILNELYQYKNEARRNQIYKTIPPMFERIKEDNNRLIYEASKNLEKLKEIMQEKSKYYDRINIIIVIFIISIVIILSLRIISDINKNRALMLQNLKNLKFAHDQIKIIIDSISNIIIITNGFEAVLVNKAFLDFFEQYKDLEEFKKEHNCICEFFANTDKEGYIPGKVTKDGQNWLNYVLEHKDKNFKVIMKKDTEDRIFEVKAVEAIKNAQEKNVIVVLTDITLYEKYTQELQNKIDKTKKELELKQKQLLQQSRLAQMGEMISMIAHQWRQPLAAISSTSGSIILKSKLGKLDHDTAINLSRKISDFSQHLSSTIDDFREFFKPNKGKKDVTYDELISSALDIVEPSIKNHNIKIVKNLKSKLIFNTYPNEIKQVMLNLLKNAEDALLEKKVENPTIYIDSEGDTFSISDNAGGIPQDIIDKIFDPYFSTKTKKDGTGIGLYMSKIIIEEHCKGKLSVKNSEIGAVFTIKLIPKAS